MWFMFIAYEQDLPWIKPGLTVRVKTPSVPNKTFTGKITFIDPSFNEATRTTKVRVELDNPLVDGCRELPMISRNSTSRANRRWTAPVP